MQPANVNNEIRAVKFRGNLDILSVSCNVLVRLPDPTSAILWSEGQLLKNHFSNPKPAIHAASTFEHAESAGGLLHSAIYVQRKLSAENRRIGWLWGWGNPDEILNPGALSNLKIQVHLKLYDGLPVGRCQPLATDWKSVVP